VEKKLAAPRERSGDRSIACLTAGGVDIGFRRWDAARDAMEIYTAADGTSRRDAIGKLSQLLGTTPARASLSVLLSISTWRLLPRRRRGCDLGGPRWT